MAVTCAHRSASSSSPVRWVCWLTTTQGLLFSMSVPVRHLDVLRRELFTKGRQNASRRCSLRPRGCVRTGYSELRVRSGRSACRFSGLHFYCLVVGAFVMASQRGGPIRSSRRGLATPPGEMKDARACRILTCAVPATKRSFPSEIWIRSVMCTEDVEI